MNKLIEVLEIQTYSRHDKLMREYLMKELASIEGCEFWDDGDNIYAGKGAGPRPCMIAHMDTVHQLCENLTAVVIKGKITGFNATRMEQTGIGGDDKVGIYVALQMLREHANIKCFFPRDEEIGCHGSAVVEPTFFDDVTIALQCDRRGNTDFITNASGVELSSKAFQDDVLPIINAYGYKFERGMMTDVMELKEQGISVSMANISCGYYNPHSDNEYVDVADVHKVCMMVSRILTVLGGTFYPHTAPKRPKFDSSKFDTDFNWWDDRDTTYSRSWSRPLDKKQHELDQFCQDCWQKPATGPSGLCDDCWDWYKNSQHKRSMDIINNKTDLSPSPIRTELDVVKELEKARKRLARLHEGKPVSVKKKKKEKRQVRRWGRHSF